MQSIFDLLAANQLLLLFTVIGVGYLIGSIRIWNLNLGVSAVLFTGMALSAIDKRLDLPEYIYIIGLVLFIYSIGLHAGPGFFSSFRKRGLRVNLVAVILLSAGALLTVAIWKVLGISGASAAGLFCGALTNTPALAATVETVKSLSQNLPQDIAYFNINAPVVTYGLAYPLGVLGVIIWFFIYSKIWKVDFSKERKEQEQEPISTQTYRITNPGIIGMTGEQVMQFMERSGFVLTRIKKGDVISILAPDTILEKDDFVVAVGTPQILEKARILLGDYADINLTIEQQPGDFVYRRIFVSNKEVVGKTIRDLQLQKRFGGIISRLRRGDVDFVPFPETILEMGDRIRFVTKRQNLEPATKFFGDSIRGVAETDFLSLSLGIVLGVFLGMIPIPLPGGSTFKLGFAGGPLIVALILGKLERTGPITWSLPFSANLVLRQVGLVLFMAAIGTKAGHGFIDTFRSGGLGLIIAGAVITSFVTVTTLFAGYKFLKLPMSAVMGMMSGMQTQPACLAYANQQAQSDAPNVWYTTVYPISMTTKIILAQILVSFLLKITSGL